LRARPLRIVGYGDEEEETAAETQAAHSPDGEAPE
jgi:hypothetical protein